MIQTNEFKGLLGDIIPETPKINRDKLSNFLYENLKDISLIELVGLLTNKYSEIIEYVNLCKGLNTCQKTSLLFNPHRLDTKTNYSKASIYESLKNKSFINGLARASIFKNGKVNELLYQVLQLGINGISYINEFPPHKSRDLAYQFGLNSESKILDPCAGWGGRMIGFSIVCNNYEAFEPSIKTYNGLLKLGKFIQGFRNEFNPIVHCLPFEESRLRKNKYDFAMTSPPYYDTERYSGEETNSLNRYKTFEKWTNNFYLPLIEKTMGSLKPNCTFVLNIGSRKYPLNKLLLSNFTKQYEIKKMKFSISGKAGLNKKGEGETFYSITK